MIRLNLGMHMAQGTSTVGGWDQGCGAFSWPRFWGKHDVDT